MGLSTVCFMARLDNKQHMKCSVRPRTQLCWSAAKHCSLASVCLQPSSTQRSCRQCTPDALCRRGACLRLAKYSLDDLCRGRIWCCGLLKLLCEERRWGRSFLCLCSCLRGPLRGNGLALQEQLLHDDSEARPASPPYHVSLANPPYHPFAHSMTSRDCQL